MVAELSASVEKISPKNSVYKSLYLQTEIGKFRHKLLCSFLLPLLQWEMSSFSILLWILARMWKLTSSLKEKQTALTAHRIISMTYPLFYKPAPQREITFGGAYRKKQVTERKIILTSSTNHHCLPFSLRRICFALRRRVENIRTVILFPKDLNKEQKGLWWPITVLGCRRTDVTSWLSRRLWVIMA